MFTGLVETTGTVDRLSPRGPGVELVVRSSRTMISELSLGESVAVDGACLTVTKWGGERFTVEASAETMSKTTLGERRVGDQVHLERALRLGDRLGGHWVTGHIDGVGTLRSKSNLGEAVQLWFDAPHTISKYLVTKGSIAIDGASLTVNELDDRGFSVVLIPHTLELLTLNHKRSGSSVNLEADILGKYVERLLTVGIGQSPYLNSKQGGVSSQPSQNEMGLSSTNPYHSSLDLSILAKAGFIK